MSLNKNILILFFIFTGVCYSQEENEVKDSVSTKNLMEVLVTATRTQRQLSSLPLPAQIISKEQLEIEMERQTPIFLEIINIKRNDKDEPKVTNKKITCSAFLTLKNEQNFEIMYLCQIYMPVIRRLFDESKDKIEEMTYWK